MKKFLKLVIGLFLLPLCWSGSRALFFLLTETSANGSAGWALPAGFLVSVLFFFLLPQAFRTYVLGHELSHAIAGLLMGAKVGRMKVGRDGGHVELSKSNFIISLAPYFFPFYTVLVIGLWYGLRFFWDLSAWEPLWLALVGLTWGFHVTFTVYMLSQHQPDVQEHGRIFSYGVIYLANLFVMALWMILIGEPTLPGTVACLSTETAAVYCRVWNFILGAGLVLENVVSSMTAG